MKQALLGKTYHKYAHITVYNLGMGPSDGGATIHDIEIRENERLLLAAMAPTGRIYAVTGEEREYQREE